MGGIEANHANVFNLFFRGLFLEFGLRLKLAHYDNELPENRAFHGKAAFGLS